MIVWRGFGILVLFIAAGFVFGGAFVADEFFGAGYWQQSAWPAAVSAAAAGAACWALGRRLNKPARKDAQHRRTWTHDLLFVRMEWWAFPLAAVALAVVLTGWKPGNAPGLVKAAGQQTQKLTGGK